MNRIQRHYLGGIVRFDLPDDWVEARDVEATGMYYLDREGSGTLRLSLLSMRPPSPDPARAISNAIAEKGYAAVQGDVAMQTQVEDSVEGDLAIRIRNTRVMFPVDDGTVRLAIFSFTTELQAGGVEDDATLAEVAEVDRAIRSAEYARKPIPDGDVQSFSALNDSDEDWLDARRVRVLDPAADRATIDAHERLRLLSLRLGESPDGSLVEALGVVFGDALVEATELTWQALVDVYGWTLCLGLPGTNVTVFPIDMLRKRVENGESIDVAALFQRTIASIDDVRARTPAVH